MKLYHLCIYLQKFNDHALKRERERETEISHNDTQCACTAKQTQDGRHPPQHQLNLSLGMYLKMSRVVLQRDIFPKNTGLKCKSTMSCYLTERLAVYPNSRGKTDQEGLPKDKMDISLMDIYEQQQQKKLPNSTSSQIEKVTADDHFSCSKRGGKWVE